MSEARQKWTGGPWRGRPAAWAVLGALALASCRISGTTRERPTRASTRQGSALITGSQAYVLLSPDGTGFQVTYLAREKSLDASSRFCFRRGDAARGLPNLGMAPTVSGQEQPHRSPPAGAPYQLVWLHA